MALDKRKEFRIDAETLKKIEAIKKAEPLNFLNDSAVIRAGIYYIYNNKIKGVK